VLAGDFIPDGNTLIKTDRDQSQGQTEKLATAPSG